jgi:hypothetical protein
MCTVLLPPGVNPIAVKYVSYHIRTATNSVHTTLWPPELLIHIINKIRRTKSIMQMIPKFRAAGKTIANIKLSSFRDKELVSDSCSMSKQDKSIWADKDLGRARTHPYAHSPTWFHNSRTFKIYDHQQIPIIYIFACTYHQIVKD